MSTFDHTRAHVALNQSEFGYLEPFELLYRKDEDTKPDIRHGIPCYIFTNKKVDDFFYVLLDGTVLRGQAGLKSMVQG